MLKSYEWKGEPEGAITPPRRNGRGLRLTKILRSGFERGTPRCCLTRSIANPVAYHGRIIPSDSIERGKAKTIRG